MKTTSISHTLNSESHSSTTPWSMANIFLHLVHGDFNLKHTNKQKHRMNLRSLSGLLLQRIVFIPWWKPQPWYLIPVRKHKSVLQTSALMLIQDRLLQRLLWDWCILDTWPHTSGVNAAWLWDVYGCRTTFNWCVITAATSASRHTY